MSDFARLLEMALASGGTAAREALGMAPLPEAPKPAAKPAEAEHPAPAPRERR
jgi:hypothetical protein